MKVPIVIPSFGESIAEATVSRLIGNTGVIVKKEDEIFEVETDKVNQVIYAPAAGSLTLLVKELDTVTPGQTVGFIEVEVISFHPIEESNKEVVTEEAVILPSSTEDHKGKEEASHQEELNRLPLEEKSQDRAKAETTVLLSTGEEDKEDKTQPVQENEKIARPSQNSIFRKKMSPLRKTLSKKLVEAKNQTAMLTTFNEVDMSEILLIRAKEKSYFEKEQKVKLGLMSFFIKAAVLALKKYPQLHAYIDQDEIVSHLPYDISIAVSTDKGLITPVLRNCEQKSFADIEQEIESLVAKARNYLLRLEDIQGGYFTITNGGIFGSLLSTPLLNFPQCAILGMHAITKRAVVVDEQIVIRPMMYLALSYDHRQIDGKEAVEFLAYIKQLLENPLHLLF